MIRQPLITTALLCLLTALAPAEEALLYSSQGFEKPHFKAGSVNGQDGWEIPSRKLNDVDPEAAVIQGVNTHEGAQALHLRNTGRRALARLPVSADSEFYLDFWLHLPPQDQFLINPAFLFRGRKQSGEFGDFLFVQFSKSGRIPNLPTPRPYKLEPQTWNRLTFRIDPAQATWDMFVNGELVVADEPARDGAFANIQILDFSWNGDKKNPDGGVFIDDLTVSREKPAF